MRKVLLLLLLSFVSTVSKADTSKLVYLYIKELNPYVSDKFAKELAKVVTKEAKKHKLDPFISIKIAMLESSLRMDAVSNTGDYGLFQINLKTLAYYKMPIEILKDLNGQVLAHMIILKDKIKICSKNPAMWGREWACYHSFTKEYNELYYARGKKLNQGKTIGGMYYVGTN